MKRPLNASVEFGAEPVTVFRFGYERFELRARSGQPRGRGYGGSGRRRRQRLCEVVTRNVGLRAAA
jgi:hypothetical protein